ncbi:MAG: nucleotidyltransferase domain-containing protein [Nanoarchaeota archaeon]|nr:nucleotidyltransferase domain-containing protein [Nanoarchaeota archaeon]
MITIKQKILIYLIENKERTFSINEISKALKIDYKLIHTNVTKLLKEHSIKVEDFGNTKRCSFDNAFNEDVYIAEDNRKKNVLKNKNFLVMYNQLKAINKQFILLMFGSQIKGTAIKNSDIDLLIISDEGDARKVGEKLRLLPYDTHLTPVTYESFMTMIKSKEFTAVSEAVKKNVIFFGIEDYYRLLENAK